MYYSGIILAGGHSHRMGQDKRYLTIKDRPLIVWVAECLVPLVDEILIVTSKDTQLSTSLFAPLSVRVVTDQYPGQGVLAGVHAGLAEAQGDWAFVIGGDMPFLNRALLQHMTHTLSGDGTSPTDIVVPRWHNSLEPLHALYRPATCAPAAEIALLQNKRRIISFYPTVRVRIVEEPTIAHWDPDGDTFFNVNTPEAWDVVLKKLNGE